LGRAAARYHEQLDDSMIRYLESRGIGAEARERFQLGRVDGGCSSEHRQYVGRLSIPYITRAGVVTLRFRRCDDLETESPKYLSLPGDIPRLYNVNDLFRDDSTLAICEGELDAITIHEFVGIPAVGVPGVSLWSPVFARMVADYPNKIIIGDGDDAGERFAHDLAKELEGRAVVMPPGTDVNGYLVQYGPLELMEVLGV
jgi:DNA primase